LKSSVTPLWPVLCYPQAEFVGPEGEPIDVVFPSLDTSGTTTMDLDLASRLNVPMWGITYAFPIMGLLRSEALAQTGLARAHGSRERAVLIPSTVFCTLVKYRWLMKALVELGKRNEAMTPIEQPNATVEAGAGLGPPASASRRLGRVAGAGRLALRGARFLRSRLGRCRAALRARNSKVQENLDGVEQRLEGVREELEGRLAAVDAKLSQVVAGIELGSVPAAETAYLGHPFVYPYDSAIGQAIDQGGEWDAILRIAVSELLDKEEPVIWEVGSNIGASLRQMLVGKPLARVVAFEPSRRFRPFLERNLEFLGSGQVEVLPLFIGRESGSSKWLYTSGTTAGVVQDSNAIVDEIPPGYEPRDRELVQITSLDELPCDRRPVDFIKVDTDGFDLEVLRGAATMLERDRPVLFFELVPGLAELVPSPVAEDLAWLQSVGYRQLLCFDPGGRVVGTTEDPGQAIAWAKSCVYCDVLTCFRGSVSEARLAGIEFGLPAAHDAVL